MKGVISFTGTTTAVNFSTVLNYSGSSVGIFSVLIDFVYDSTIFVEK